MLYEGKHLELIVFASIAVMETPFGKLLLFHLELPLQSVNIEGLKRALSDPNYTVRLEAIITCASRAVNGPQEELHPGKAG